MRTLGLLGLVLAIGIAAWLTLLSPQKIQPAAAPSIPAEAAAKQARYALEGLRSAIAAFHARSLLKGGPPWPTATQLQDGHSVLAGPMPDNPFGGGNRVGDGGGWAYDPQTGKIRLSTDTPDLHENGW